MAIIYPGIDVIKRQKVPPTEGERKLLNFLWDSLDDSYEIYYQPYLNGDNPDIVIMKKGSGVLIIEVKDWNLSHYKCVSQCKYCNAINNCDCNSSNNHNKEIEWSLLKNNTILKSPLYQVEKYKSNLFHLHLEHLNKKIIENPKNWATVNCAVYFHNASEVELRNFLLESFPVDEYAEYHKFVSYIGLLGHDSLNSKKLDSLFSKFWLNKKSYLFDESLYNSFSRYLKPPIHQLEEGIKINYSKAQQELIRSEIRPRRKIKGVAGCGKTLVLAKRAVNANKRTKEQVLILTYNLSLKNYIHDRISDVREEFSWSSFYITNYHQFFKSQANNYNLKINNLSDFQMVNFFENKKNIIQKFNVVLIDEIQDYKQSWIDIITKYFTHSETEFIVFGDEKQNIYKRKLDKNNEPIVRGVSGAWNKSLKTSHRFSSNIGNIAIKFQKEIFKQKYNLDEVNFMSQLDFVVDRVIEYHYFHSFTAEDLFRNIYNVLERNKIHSSDSGILCSKVEILRELDFAIRTRKKEKTTTTFESNEEYEKIKMNKREIEKVRRIKKNHFWMKTGTVKLSTVHSFKGWEVDTLFLLIEKEEDGSEFTNAELIYTALTRAKRNLIVFNLNNTKYNSFFRNEIQNCFEHN